MSTKQTVWTVVVVVAVVLLGWWSYSMMATPAESVAVNPTPTSTDNTGTTGTVTPPSPTPVGSGNTLSGVFAQNSSTVCKYNKVTPSGQSNDVIYISNGKVRAEFRDMGTNGNLMVYTGGTLYRWKEGSTVGTKTQVKTLAELPLLIPKDLTSASIFGSSLDNVSWDCHPWNTDVNLLVPPAQVKFSAV